MKRLAVLACLAMLTWSLAACGPATVNESQLPTLVPTYPPGAQALVAVVTPEPAAPTPPPTEPAATPAVEPTATVAPTPAPTATAEPTPAPTATAEPTATAAPAASAEVTGATEIDAAAVMATGLSASDSAETAPVTGSSSAPLSGSANSVAEADLLPGLTAALADADPARGQQLTVQNACTACHALDPALVMPGPTWHGLADRAGQRVAGQSAAYYLYNSIVHPNDYVVEGYLAGIMLSTYKDTVGERDLADIIAYLLTLKAGE